MEKRNIEKHKQAVIDFLDNENYDIQFVQEFKGYSVFMCVDTTIPKHTLTGLPIFVLTNGRETRFADAEETLELI